MGKISAVIFSILVIVGCQTTTKTSKEPVSKPKVVSAELVSSIISPVIVQNDIIVEKDITFATVDGVELKLDIARPAISKGLLPAIIFIPTVYYMPTHGWELDRYFDKADFIIETYIAATRDYVGIGLEIRHVPASRFPSQINDVARAVRWLRANSSQYGIDPSRIAVMGEGTGAHLALLLGFVDETAQLSGDCGDNEYSSRIQAVVSVNGPSDLIGWHRYCTDYADIVNKEEESFKFEYYVEKLMGGSPEDMPEQYRMASPINYVSRDDPPVFSIHSEEYQLVPFEQTETLDVTLREVGVAHVVLLKKIDWLLDRAGVSPAAVYIPVFDFLDEHLGDI